MIHTMFNPRIYEFWLKHQFRCCLLDISPEIMKHDVVLQDSNYLFNCLQLFSQEVASLSPRGFQFRGLEESWNLTLTN